jgi:UDP-N-acetylglucosamine--N-acetylmuramyl-(pentapeptide) pyrophosphoryl-undecaprenol N-acetylglucosamine transferase
MKVIIAGGGTGGHLFPAVALGEEMKRQRSTTEVLHVGTSAGFEARWLPKSGLSYELFEVHGLRGRGLLSRVRALGEFVSAIARARALLRRFRADLVVSAGGYASAPMAVAAIMARTPLILMEQNTRPGLANRALWRFANRICVGFNETASFFSPAKVEVTGNPVRFSIVPDEGREVREPLQILVLGGSTGAHRLNIGVVKAFKNIGKRVIKLHLVHQTGEADVGLVTAGYRQLGWDVQVVSFIDEMAAALKRADLVIARAGAMTVSEIALAGRAAIFVPYPFHRDRQQELNARVLETLGAAIMIRDDEHLANNLARVLGELAADPARIAEMGRRASGVAKRDAAARIARVCFEAVGEERAAA